MAMKTLINRSSFLCILLPFLVLQLVAQDDLTQLWNIEVYDENDNLKKFPWLGGLSSPQFSHIDLNLDGNEDLFIFDRTDSRIYTFLNNNEESFFPYDYAPEYETIFPSELFGWTLLRDMNCDGINDIVSSNINVIAYYEGSIENNELVYNISPELIYSDEVPLSIAAKNLPAIRDVDGDGDMDIMILSNAGFLQLHTNQSIETTGDCSNLSFSLTDGCWGGLEFLGYNTSGNLGISCLHTEQIFSPRHGGYSLNVYDWDQDNDVDVFIGDFTFNTVTYFENGGENTLISQDTIFPAHSAKVDIQRNPMVYFINLDADPALEMIAAPNDEESGVRHPVWFYESDGSILSEQYLSNEMIELGKGAYPLSWDYDNDGDSDLLLTNIVEFENTGNRSTFTLYENISSSEDSSPKFKQKDNNFLDFGNLELIGSLPTIGDLDDDGDDDFLLGTQAGTLVFIENIGTASQPALGNPNFDYQDILIPNGTSTPLLLDYDDDGDLDLLSGNTKGLVFYYENIGTLTTPQFEETSISWLNDIDVSFDENLGYSYPSIINKGMDEYLMISNNQGKVEVYDKINGILVDSWNFGENDYSRIGLSSISHSQNDYLIMGNYRGGLEIFLMENTTSNNTIISNHETVSQIFPNPNTNGKVYIESRKDIKSINLTNISGMDYGQYPYTKELDVSSFPNGLYIIELEFENMMNEHHYLIIQ